MTNVHCIVGLPGSGKTWLANKMAADLINPIILDDITSPDDLPVNGAYSDVIITDPYFCSITIRVFAGDSLKDKYGNVTWIFFENNKEKCLINVDYRNDGRKVVELIRHLSKDYKIPNSHKPIEIWQPS